MARCIDAAEVVRIVKAAEDAADRFSNANLSASRDVTVYELAYLKASLLAAAGVAE